MGLGLKGTDSVFFSPSQINDKLPISSLIYPLIWWIRLALPSTVQVAIEMYLVQIEMGSKGKTYIGV